MDNACKNSFTKKEIESQFAKEVKLLVLLMLPNFFCIEISSSVNIYTRYYILNLCTASSFALVRCLRNFLYSCMVTIADKPLL